MGLVRDRLRLLIEQSPLGVHVFAPDGTSLLTNPAWDELWYLGPEEVSEGTSIFEDEQLEDAGLIPYAKRGIAGGTVVTPPLLFDPSRTGREGEPRWLRAFVHPVEDASGRVLEVALMLEDVSEQKKLEDRLRHQALHDDLTGLPNRASFVESLDRALDGAGRGEVAVLFLDLDNFKVINDSLGHRAGDRLLVCVAERLEGCLRPRDTVARFGGDEFTVLLEHVARRSCATRVAERLVRELRAPFVVDGREVFATTSIGIVFGGVGEGADGLLRDADIAMYSSKAGGKDRYEVFEEAMKDHSSKRLNLDGELRRAVERGEFVVHYQPEVGLETGEVVGVEALVRWRRPESGLVPPADFIPLAEETGLIVPIGRWVIREACRQAKEWEAQGPDGHCPAVGVNLSPRQFLHPDLVEDLARILDETGLPPSCLELEITEGALSADAHFATLVLARLRELGVRIAIDDFGTGYSSLSRLKHLRVDTLKIDRSFVSGLGEDPGDGVLVSGMIGMALGLGLGVVAEGVETPKQVELLRRMGCRSAQGYHFAPPLDGEAASESLLSRTRYPTA